jgi:hypothetical protein
MNWVRQNDPGDYYVRHTPTNAWHEATIATDLRFIEVWYHFADIRSLDGKVNQRWVQALPNFLTQTPQEVTPDNSQLIQVVEGYNIFYLTNSLPMAFLVDQSVLAQDSNLWLQASEVIQQSPFFSSTGKVEVIAEGDGDQMLVMLITNYPGWKVIVDGVQQPLLNVGGYLAVNAMHGVHKYTFIYQPCTFFIGLVISLATSLITGYFIVKELQVSRSHLRQHCQAWLVTLRGWQIRLRDWWHSRQPISGRAVYQTGLLRLDEPLDLPENSQVSLTVDGEARNLPYWREALRRWTQATAGLVTALWRSVQLPAALFALGLSVYLITRLIGLTDWPIYFFTDEAVQTVMAEDFLHSGLRNYSGELLPTYFNKDSTYNLSSLSVYLQVIPTLIFGKSVFVTRAVSVLVATFGAVMVGLILRDIFKIRYWWSGVLLLSIAPAWFLHSRTAFETVEMSSFYAGFLYFYLRYRYLSPRSLYAALVFGALVFYTYSPGQLIIVVTGVFLLLSDLRYHWQQRKVGLRGLLLLGILVLPYLRYYLAHPEAPLQHLTTRAPFWLQDIPLRQKLLQFLKQYLSGLDPRYWFWPNQRDLDRHLMLGYGHLRLTTLPFYAVGLILCLFKPRSPANRTVLLALLAAPAGSALVDVGITRLLVLIIPAILLMTLGLNQLLEWLVDFSAWLVKRFHHGTVLQPEKLTRTHAVLALLLAGVLCTSNVTMLRDAMVNGSRWFQDYTLAGMQYGARQLFQAVINYYETNPGVSMIVSPSWTNGADAVAEFFLPPNAPVRLGSVEGHIFQHFPLDDNMVFVVIPNELDKVLLSGKFEDVRIEQILEYPNGEPGFYFIRLRYVENIDTILEAEQESRRSLQETTLLIDGQEVQVRYSMLDMGSINLVFDGSPTTVARTLEANPFVIELAFPEIRQVSGVSLVLGSSSLHISVTVTTAPSMQPITYEVNFAGSVGDPDLNLNFGETLSAQSIRFEIFAQGIAEPTNIHVWEITMRE